MNVSIDVHWLSRVNANVKLSIKLKNSKYMLRMWLKIRMQQKKLRGMQEQLKNENNKSKGRTQPPATETRQLREEHDSRTIGRPSEEGPRAENVSKCPSCHWSGTTLRSMTPRVKYIMASIRSIWSSRAYSLILSSQSARSELVSHSRLACHLA